jgi:hypothetical protein
MIVDIISISERGEWVVEVSVYLPYGKKSYGVRKVVIDGEEYNAESEYMKRLLSLTVEARKVEVRKEGNIFVALISTA